MSTKLHQLLAAESDRKRSANEVLNESISTFKNKKEHFEGFRRKYTNKEEDGVTFEPENKPLVTTVTARLNYTVKIWKRWLDVLLQKEETNAASAANAEVHIGETSFGTFSATSLLALEKNLNRFIEMLREVPTLDPLQEWELDASEQNIYKTEPEITHKTQKRQKPIVLYEATKEHPAQVELVSYDVIIGEWSVTRSSGKITPAEKHQMLDRAEELLIAVKKARAKANECGVVPVKSDKFFNYILQGKIG